MQKPLLVVMEASISNPLTHEKQLNRLLEDKAEVKVEGSAADLTVEEYLDYYILGKRETEKTRKLVQKDQCDMYVGIKHEKDDYKLAENGFELAEANGIPACMMDNYSALKICDFVDRCLQGNSPGKKEGV